MSKTSGSTRWTPSRRGAVGRGLITWPCKVRHTHPQNGDRSAPLQPVNYFDSLKEIGPIGRGASGARIRVVGFTSTPIGEGMPQAPTTGVQTPDEILVRRAREGDASAREELFLRHRSD